MARCSSSTRRSDAPFSTVWHYDRATLLGSATTESMTELVEPDPKVDVMLLGHDFAFVPAHQEEGEAVLDRLYVTAADGNQTFAFDFVRGSSAGLELKPLEVYLPMRLFSGKALVAAGTQLFYDFGERWIPLLPQKRRRYVTEATLLTPVFDGDEPDCVWHRLMLDGCLPPESSVEIWSRTANDKTDLQSAPWQDEPPLYRRGDGSELPWFPKPRTPNAGTWELLFQRARGPLFAAPDPAQRQRPILAAIARAAPLLPALLLSEKLPARSLPRRPRIGLIP